MLEFYEVTFPDNEIHYWGRPTFLTEEIFIKQLRTDYCNNNIIITQINEENLPEDCIIYFL